MGDQQILNEREAALKIGVTVHALRRWRWLKKEGPAYLKLGACVRYRAREIEAFLENHLVNHEADQKTPLSRRRRARNAA
jgi:hypothetical protein